MEPDKFRPAVLVVKGILGPRSTSNLRPNCLKKILKQAKGLSLETEGLLPVFAGLKNRPKAVSWSGTDSGNSFVGMKFPRVFQEKNERVLKQSQIPRMPL